MQRREGLRLDSYDRFWLLQLESIAIFYTLPFDKREHPFPHYLPSNTKNPASKAMTDFTKRPGLHYLFEDENGAQEYGGPTAKRKAVETEDATEAITEEEE